MRTLGIDFGDARVGIAVCDEAETVSTAVCTLNVRGIEDAAAQSVKKAEELNCERIVIGMPRNMDGSYSFRAERTERFAELVKGLINLPIEFYDERLSTVAAHGYLNSSGIGGKKRKKVVDALSAQIILQDYIDSQKNKR